MRGRPVLREALLPDEDTELDMDGLYKECIRLQMRDMEIVSLIRLYGVTSFSTGARVAVHVCAWVCLNGRVIYYLDWCG